MYQYGVAGCCVRRGLSPGEADIWMLPSCVHFEIGFLPRIILVGERLDESDCCKIYVP
jgi:hypothetical protein